jgi:hypothetical protein
MDGELKKVNRNVLDLFLFFEKAHLFDVFVFGVERVDSVLWRLYSGLLRRGFRSF